MPTMEIPPPTLQGIKALTFDVFGTVVDWRTTVEGELAARARAKADSPATDLDPAVRGRLGALSRGDWAAFAQQWRDSYGAFTRAFEPGRTPWKDIDAHHRDSLAELLARWGLAGAYNAYDGGGEVRDLSLVWHRLRPWADAREGLRALGARFATATLSNGNRALLRDLNDGPGDDGDDDAGVAAATTAGGEGSGEGKGKGLGFQRIISAEDFGAYKPHPSTYLGAAGALGCEPGEVAMVAAHLGDLAGARACGLRTIYVARPGEEAWGPDEERYREARGWVDLWVGEGEGGFVEVARRLGIPTRVDA